MDNHEKINYLEFPAKDIQLAKTFFGQVFGWSFEDYGPDYIALSNAVSSAGIDLGFYHAPLVTSTANGSALVVFYSKTLAQTQAKIEDNGGTIVKAVFDFPGGRRFHFTDPNGNEFAVWSDVEASAA